jgi:hypothetical protein
MEVFLKCAPSAHFSGTTLDYTLDQLFIHLDDPEHSVQKAVSQVIVVAASIDKGLVIKKARLARSNHRTPAMCDAILLDVEGFQVLEG